MCFIAYVISFQKLHGLTLMLNMVKGNFIKKVAEFSLIKLVAKLHSSTIVLVKIYSMKSVNQVF